MLLARLPDTDAEPLLDKLVRHRALGGPELIFLQARLAHQRGDTTTAGTLITAALGKLPGHQEMLDFATEIDAPRGLTATVNRAIATPAGVNRSSGLSVRLPTTVITVELSTGQPCPRRGTSTDLGARRTSGFIWWYSCRNRGGR